jgi:hypothetical protein
VYGWVYGCRAREFSFDKMYDEYLITKNVIITPCLVHRNKNCVQLNKTKLLGLNLLVNNLKTRDKKKKEQKTKTKSTAEKKGDLYLNFFFV